ncbi:atrial natriuretic peptide receptor 2-like [Saccoglossus kowalevskii]
MTPKQRTVLVTVLMYLLDVRIANSDEFRVLLLMPSQLVLPFGIPRIGSAALIAFDEVNADDTLLSGHILTFDTVDTMCHPVLGLGLTVELLATYNYSGLIGPLCSTVCRHVATLSTFYNLPTFSAVCSDNEMLDKNQFGTLVRTFGPFTKAGRAVMEIFKQFEWERTSLISDDYLVWSTPMNGLRLAIKEANITAASFYEGHLDDDNLGTLLAEAADISRKSSSTPCIICCPQHATPAGITQEEAGLKYITVLRWSAAGSKMSVKYTNFIFPSLFLLILHGINGEKFRLLIPLPSQIYLPVSISRTAAAALIAIEKVNADDTLLPGHSLVHDEIDTLCDSVHGLGVIVEKMKDQNYSAFIGPSCSAVCRHVARLGVFYNIPTFSPLCSDNEMRDKTVFKTLVRTVGPQSSNGKFMAAVSQLFNWKRVAIVTDDYLVWSISSDGVKLALNEANVTINFYLQDNLDNKDLGDILADAAVVSRIIILSAWGHQVREFMIHAYDQGLINGEYAFICIYHYKDVVSFGDFSWDQGTDEEENQKAKKAYEALMFLAVLIPDYDEYTDFTKEVKARSSSVYGYVYADDEDVSIIAGYLHDAVYLYAVALNETINEGGNPYDGLTIAHRVYSRTDLPGVLRMTIDDNGDLDSDYMLLDMQYHDDDSYKLTTVGYYYGKDKVYVPKTDTEIQWPGGATEPPLDTPICGYKGELCRDTKPLGVLPIIGIVLAILVVVLLVLFIILYRRYRQQKDIADMLWKIDFHDIIISDRKDAESFSSKLSLISSARSVKSVAEQVFTTTGIYKGVRQAIKYLDHSKFHLTRATLIELRQLHGIQHPNLTRFVGACVEPKCCLVTEYCPKGSLAVCKFRLRMQIKIASAIPKIKARFILWRQEIVEKVRIGGEPLCRPVLGMTDCTEGGKNLMRACWAEDPISRPDFHRIRLEIKKMNSVYGNSENIMDNMVRRMEHYANNLEAIVTERTSQLAEEQKKSEQLLHQLLPKAVADQLKQGNRVEAETYECVTIYFSDIVGFTSMSAQSTPMEVVTFLNDLYVCFDDIIGHFDVYKESAGYKQDYSVNLRSEKRELVVKRLMVGGGRLSSFRFLTVNSPSSLRPKSK